MKTPEPSTANQPVSVPLFIREATPADVSEMLVFIRELAEYERAPDAAIATAEDLLRDGFGPRPLFQCLIAEWEGKPAAMALYFPFYSTWRGNAGIHLEDLFVRPQFRRNGIAKALFARLAAIALERGDRFQWHVLEPARPRLLQTDGSPHALGVAHHAHRGRSTGSPRLSWKSVIGQPISFCRKL
jgi:GNAT superfamily N-acetyltransferase